MQCAVLLIAKQNWHVWKYWKPVDPIWIISYSQYFYMNYTIPDIRCVPQIIKKPDDTRRHSRASVYEQIAEQIHKNDVA